jgi:hypothetical protein
MKTHKSENKIVRALIIVLALIFLSGMAIEKRVEAHIIVSKYRFPYLVLGSGPITWQMLQDQQLSGTPRLIFGHYKRVNILLEVFVTPKCSVIDES